MRSLKALVLCLAACQSPQSERTLPSGLVCHELRAGEGAPLAAGDLAVVTYVARRADGQVFEERTAAGREARIPVAPSNPIFWPDALALMHPGGRYSLRVPATSTWPAPLRPAWLPADGHVTYEVEVLRAIRFVAPMRPDPARTLAGDGFEYQVLAAGDAHAPDTQPTATVELDFTAWDQHGNVIDSTRPLEQPARFQPARAPTPFLARAAMAMKPGARWICAVPAQLALPRAGAVLAPEAPTWWMVELRTVSAKR